jgi:hypothetical protein
VSLDQLRCFVCSTWKRTKDLLCCYVVASFKSSFGCNQVTITSCLKNVGWIQVRRINPANSM